MNDNEFEETTIDLESPEQLEREKERRKGMRSFLNTMIALCVIPIGVLSVFIAFPLPKEMLDKDVTIFFAMELLSFFPFINVLGILLTLTGKNKRSNSGLIIRVLAFMGSYVLLGNVIIIFLLRNLG